MPTATRRPARKPAATAAKAAAPSRARKAPKAVAAPVEAPAAKPAAKPEPKPPKKPKPVLVRDGFTMPEADFALIGALKKRAAAAGREAKKSELLRAGLQALAALEAAALVASLNRLEAVKVGRPRKGH
jgi:hypothetical protein